MKRRSFLGLLMAIPFTPLSVKFTNAETVRKAEFIAKLVRPPLPLCPEIKGNPSCIMPGCITYFSKSNGDHGFFPLFEVDPKDLKFV